MRWRKFLETPASGVDSYVALAWNVEANYPEAILKIADCDRRVSLYFGLKTKKQVRNARRKLNGLREAIDRLEAVISQYE